MLLETCYLSIQVALPLSSRYHIILHTHAYSKSSRSEQFLDWITSIPHASRPHGALLCTHQHPGFPPDPIEMATTRSAGVRQRKAKAAAATEETAPLVEEVDTDEAEEIEREREEVEAERLRRKDLSPEEKLEEEDDDYKPWVDILRVISFLIFASCALSYLISGGETFTWGMKHPPKYLQADWWKAKFVGSTAYSTAPYP